MINNREVTILADGQFPTGERALEILRCSALVVCCDGAVDSAARAGIEPIAVVGDCDSMSEESAVKYAAIIHRDPDQETNDLTKAVNFCVAHGLTEITILGATGKREDHTLGNISLILDYMHIASVRLVSDYGEFRPIDSTTSFECTKGSQISVFNLDPRATVRYEGLRYTLANNNIRSWWSGTLNECTGDKFTIITDSPAIVFRAF